METAIRENRPRVLQAAKALLRYIARSRLGTGDRLPQQQELRSALGFSNDSISPAMKLLVDLGVLSRRPGLGTLVVDPAAATPGLWNIGIPLIDARACVQMPFFGQLSQYLLTHLREAGFGCVTFPSPQNRSLDPQHLPDVPELKHAGEAGEIDGIVSPLCLLPDVQDWARELEIPLCHVGPWGAYFPGVLIDERQFVLDAARKLYDAGARRIALVCHSAPNEDKMHWVGYQEAIAQLEGAQPQPALWAGFGLEAGHQVAQKTLEQPAEERPDGLIIVDDRLAMGLTSTLRRLDGDYRPQIAAQTNRQLRVTMSLPIFAFDVDVEQLAVEAVELLGRQLTAPPEPTPPIRYVAPTYAGRFEADAHENTPPAGQNHQPVS